MPHFNARTPHPRSRQTVTRLAWSIILAAFISGCGPQIALPPQQADALPRSQIWIPSAPGEADWMLSYLHVGDANHQRVIFIHGTPGSADDYADYLANPIPGLEILAVDRLGFGRSFPGDHGSAQKFAPLSDSPRRPTGAVTSFEKQARSIEPLLVKQNGRWPILVGHSLGGPIAARIAADYPDRVDSLVILAGSLDPSLEELHWYNDVAQWIVLNPIMPLMFIHSNQEILAAKHETTELASGLRNIRCPVIVIHGTADPLVPFANAAYIKREFVNCPRLEIVELPNENHFIPWLHASEVRAAIVRLRDQNPTTAPGSRP